MKISRPTVGQSCDWVRKQVIITPALLYSATYLQVLNCILVSICCIQYACTRQFTHLQPFHRSRMHVVLQIKVSSLSTTVKHRGDNLLAVQVIRWACGPDTRTLTSLTGVYECGILSCRPGGSKIALVRCYRKFDRSEVSSRRSYFLGNTRPANLCNFF